MIDVALRKDGKTALALKYLMFIVLYSTQQEVTKNNKSWDAAPCHLGSWALVVPKVCICCWCASGYTFLCVDPTARAGVNVCAGVLQTINWICVKGSGLGGEKYFIFHGVFIFPKGAPSAQMPGKNTLDLYILPQCLQQDSTSCRPEVRLLASGAPAAVLQADMFPQDVLCL